MKKVLFALPVILVFLSLLFRLTIYSKIPVMPSNPYGLGDIIELWIYVVLGIFCLTNVLYGFGQLIGKERNFKIAGLFVLNALICFFGYPYFHSLVA